MTLHRCEGCCGVRGVRSRGRERGKAEEMKTSAIISRDTRRLTTDIIVSSNGLETENWRACPQKSWLHYYDQGKLSEAEPL